MYAKEAKSLGKKLGVYHFATGNSSGQAEADFFIQNVKGYIGEAILVLDWEAKAVKKGVGYAKAFLDRVHERTGVKPLIYMSNSVIHEHDWSSVVAADYGLWNAGYYAGGTGGGISPVPTPAPAPPAAGDIAELQNECNVQGFSAQKVDNIAGPITLAGCPMLRKGAQGNITRWVQKKLNALGYNCGNADGIFGVKTKAGIMAFQKSKRIAVDGIVGPQTWSKLLHLS